MSVSGEAAVAWQAFLVAWCGAASFSACFLKGCWRFQVTPALHKINPSLSSIPRVGAVAIQAIV